MSFHLNMVHTRQQAYRETRTKIEQNGSTHHADMLLAFRMLVKKTHKTVQLLSSHQEGPACIAHLDNLLLHSDVFAVDRPIGVGLIFTGFRQLHHYGILVRVGHRWLLINTHHTNRRFKKLKSTLRHYHYREYDLQLYLSRNGGCGPVACMVVQFIQTWAIQSHCLTMPNLIRALDFKYRRFAIIPHCDEYQFSLNLLGRQQQAPDDFSTYKARGCPWCRCATLKKYI